MAMAEQAQNGAQSKKLSYQSFAIISLISSVTALSVIALVLLFMNWRARFSVFDRGNCVEVYQGLMCFIDEPLDESALVSVLSGFYTNIIVILIAILALVATISTISIRFSSRQHVESELPDLTEAYFTSAVGSSKVELILSKKLGAVEGDLRKQDELLNAMLSKIERIEYRLEDLDTGESVEPPEEMGDE